MRELWCAATLAAVTVLGPCAPGMAQDDADQKLGTVHFATSCNETAQRRFDRAMRYQHSFWYRESQGNLRGGAQGRPGLRHRLLGHRADACSAIPTARHRRQIFSLGLAAIEKAKAIGAKTERERDYIDALAVMYVDYDKIPQRGARAVLPQGDGGAGGNTIPTTTKRRSSTPSRSTWRRRRPTRPTPTSSRAPPSWSRSGKRQPQHPGVAHYLIHLYDYPAIAAKGLDAARRYAKIAPALAACAAHAVAHFHARRLLEGIDRVEHGFGAGRKGRQGVRRAAAWPGLSGLRLSAARAGHEGAAPSSTK